MEEKRALNIQSKKRLGFKFKRRIEELNYQKDRLISFNTARTSTIPTKPMVTNGRDIISEVSLEVRNKHKETDTKRLKQKTSHTLSISDKDRLPQPIACENKKVVETNGDWYHNHLGQELGKTYAAFGAPFTLFPATGFYPPQSFPLVMYGTLPYGMIAPYQLNNYGGISKSDKE